MVNLNTQKPIGIILFYTILYVLAACLFFSISYYTYSGIGNTKKISDFITFLFGKDLTIYIYWFQILVCVIVSTISALATLMFTCIYIGVLTHIRIDREQELAA